MGAMGVPAMKGSYSTGLEPASPASKQGRQTVQGWKTGSRYRQGLRPPHTARHRRNHARSVPERTMPRRARLLRLLHRASKPVSLVCSDGAIVHDRQGTAPASRHAPGSGASQPWRTVAHPWFTVGLGVKSLILQGAGESPSDTGSDRRGSASVVFAQLGENPTSMSAWALDGRLGGVG